MVAISPSEVQRITKERFKREAITVEHDHLLDRTFEPKHEVAARTHDRIGGHRREDRSRPVAGKARSWYLSRVLRTTGASGAPQA